MSTRYFEDFQTGRVEEYGPRLVTRAEIIAFATEFDPQPMHLDEAAAATTMLGGLAASGWHTCCIMMRMMADGFLLESTSMGSPGVKEVKWQKPLHPGTKVKLRATILDARASKTRPSMGLVTIQLEILDAAEETIMTATTPIMFGRRPDAGTAA